MPRTEASRDDVGQIKLYAVPADPSNGQRLGCNQPIYAIVQAAIVVRQMAIQRCCVFLHINPPTTPSNWQNKYTKNPLGKLIPANLS